MVDVTLRTVAPQAIAAVIAQTTWDEFPSAWRPMLDQVWRFLRSPPPGLYKDGHNVMLYKDDVPNVEVGVQVSGPFERAGDVVPSRLPGGLVATATHTGPIAAIGDTHAAVCRWCEEHGYRRTGVRWEVYGDPDPTSGAFTVDVFWVVAPPAIQEA